MNTAGVFAARRTAAVGAHRRPGPLAGFRCALGGLSLLMLAACAPPGTVDEAFASADFDRVRDLLLPLARGGDAAAQNRLATLHYLGLGTAVDYPRAARWYKRAALAGNPDAQRNLGSLFRQGLGVPRDDIRAFGWYDVARRNGNPRAEGYMQWMTQYVGWNQQAFARRIVADDLKLGTVSECGEGRPMSTCPPREPGTPAAGSTGPSP